jgi:hypothetical protein
MNAPGHDGKEFTLGDDGELLDPISEGDTAYGKQNRLYGRKNQTSMHDSVLGFYLFVMFWSGAFIVECFKRVTTELDKVSLGLICAVPIFVIAAHLAIKRIFRPEEVKERKSKEPF